MKTVFLKDGQEAKLVREVDEKTFIVCPIIIFEGYEGEQIEGYASDIIVDRVFEKPPMKKKTDELLSIEKALDERRKDIVAADKSIRDARAELEAIKRQKTDLQKLIIDKSELRAAKRITIFESGIYNPISVTEKITDVKFSLNIGGNGNEMSCWAYKLSYDNWSHSNYFDEKIGLLIDKSDEEITEIAKRRVIENAEKIKQYHHTLALIRDEYLTPDLLELKTANKMAANLKRIEEVKAQIEYQQTQLSLLEGKQIQSEIA